MSGVSDLQAAFAAGDFRCEADVQSALHNWLVGSPDGYVRSEGMVPIKAPSMKDIGGIPDLLYVDSDATRIVVVEVKFSRAIRRTVDLASACGQVSLYRAGIEMALLRGWMPGIEQVDAWIAIDDYGWTDSVAARALLIANDVAVYSVAPMLDRHILPDGSQFVWPDDVTRVFDPAIDPADPEDYGEAA